MDDEVRSMTNGELADGLRGLLCDYPEGCERDVLEEAARRIDEARDESSDGKKRYTAVILSCGPLILLEGELEKYRRALVDSNGEDMIISGSDEQGRRTCIMSSKIGAIYDYGEINPSDLFI